MFFCPSILGYVFQWLLDTCGLLSPVERHTNSNCLECLAHGRVCFRGFMQEQVIGGRTTTVIRTRCIFAELFGRIRVNYSDRTEYEQNIQYSPSDYHHHTSFIDDINDSLLLLLLSVISLKVILPLAIDVTVHGMSVCLSRSCTVLKTAENIDTIFCIQKPHVSPRSH